MIDPKVTLHVLIDLSRTLATETALEVQLDRVVRAALALLEAEHAAIRVLDESGTELLSGARAGVGIDHRPVTFGRGVGIAGWIVDHGETVRLEEAGEDPRFAPVQGQGFAIRSLLGVPLTVSGSVIGCLVATSSKPAAFGAAHEDLALLLASVACSPIERARLEAIALRDATTRAFGARYLAPRLSGEVTRARTSGGSVALIALELDGLAGIRDRMGRAAGESVLRLAVDRILGVVRARGVVIRRDAGEMVIVLPQTLTEDAETIADRIEETLARRVTELGPGLEELDLSACMGIACWNGTESPTRLERRADEALRAAKGRGAGTIAVWGGATPDE